MQNHTRLPNETDEQYDIRINKDIAAFSYLWIMSVVIYFVRHDSKFVRYHAKQGIVLFLLSIPAAMIPVLGRILILLIVGGVLLGFIHAAHGQYAPVPVIGDLAKGDLKIADLWKSILKALKQGLEALEAMAHRKPAEKKEEPPKPMDSTSKPPVP
jgi:uncharacterized membrane protein